MSSKKKSTKKKQEDGVPERFQGKTFYEVLGLETNAAPDDIKKAYRKLSLRYHPDRNQSPTATEDFQYLAKVHQTLSDPKKRQYYDQTGEADDSASGSDFESSYEYWRALFPKITEEDIEAYREKYIGSEEEKEDILDAVARYKGDMRKVMESVPFASSEAVERFVAFISKQFESASDEDEEDSKLDSAWLKKFKSSSKNLKAKMEKEEKEEAEEAEEEAKKANVKVDTKDSLTALIQARQADRAKNMGSFFDQMEAKYAAMEEEETNKKSKSKAKGKAKASSKGTKRNSKKADLPTDEEFEALQKKMAKKGGGRK